MARIAGIDLPKDKRIEIGLTYIYGIGRKSAKDILAKTGVDPDVRVKDLSELEKKQYLDLNLWLPGDILLKADKMSMAHSLELRVPYLDRAAQGCVPCSSCRPSAECPRAATGSGQGIASFPARSSP